MLTTEERNRLVILVLKACIKELQEKHKADGGKPDTSYKQRKRLLSGCIALLENDDALFRSCERYGIWI